MKFELIQGNCKNFEYLLKLYRELHGTDNVVNINHEKKNFDVKTKENSDEME